VITLLLSLLIHPVANAGKLDEELLHEKSIKQEADRNFEHLFRLMSLQYPIRDYAYVIKVYLSRETAKLPPRGLIIFKVRIGENRFAERSRKLIPKEIDLVWKTFYGEEIFSLPAKQTEVPELSDPAVRDGPGNVIFSHFENRTHHSEEVTRCSTFSQPAARTAKALGELVSDLVRDIERK